MITDFLDAHQRHWDDAERLFNAKRWANADHLYGLTAECGIKRLMLAFGMPFDAGRNAPAKHEDRAHAHAIWSRLETTALDMDKARDSRCLPRTLSMTGIFPIATPIKPTSTKTAPWRTRTARRPSAI